MLPVVERFIRYAKIHTESDRETGLVPSTPGQLQFAYLLCEEMQKIGMQIESVLRSVLSLTWIPVRT